MTSTEDILELQKSASVTRLLLITSVALVPDIEAFFGFSFATPAITYYTNENVTVLEAPLTNEQISWFASSLSLFILLSSLFCSSLIDVLGRKPTLLLATLLQVIAWGLLQISQEFPVLMVNRMLMGVAIGILVPCILAYLLDISPICMRGLMGSVCISAKNMASTTCLVIVAMIGFQPGRIVMTCPAVIFLICYPWLPESPQWLVSKDRGDEAEQALLMIRGSHYDAKTELLEMKRIHDEENNDLKHGGSQGGPSMLSPEFLKPLCIMMTLMSVAMWSGPGLLFTYSLKMAEGINLPIDPYFFAIGTQGLIAVGYIFSLSIATFVPRRPLFLTTSTLITCSMITTTFSLIDPGMEQSNWLFPLSLFTASFFYGLGCSPVLFTLTGEVFPPLLKGRGSGISFASRHVALFGILKLYPSLDKNFGVVGIFAAQTLMSAFLVIFAYAFMPETHRLSLTELSRLYKPAEDTMMLLEKTPKKEVNLNMPS